jgi:putative ABC transport system ATP-binding protein
MLHRWFNRPARAAVAPGASERDASAPLIELRQVVKTYATPAGEFTALKRVDLQVNRNEFVAVIGKSGSGKSTLINTITGIDQPTTGEVLVCNTPIHTLNESELAGWRSLWRPWRVIFRRMARRGSACAMCWHLNRATNAYWGNA